MPVYLFSYHGYRTWMPDHRRGYTKRGKGYQPTDPEMSRKYEERAKHEKTVLTLAIQRALIEEAMIAAPQQRFRLHASAGEPTHIQSSRKLVRREKLDAAAIRFEKFTFPAPDSPR